LLHSSSAHWVKNWVGRAISPAAEPLGCIGRQHFAGCGMGCVARGAVHAGAPLGCVDGLVYPLHGGDTCRHGLDFQQHRQERVWRSGISRNPQPELVSFPRQILRSAYCGSHHHVRGHDSRGCVGTKNVSKIRKHLTGTAAAHHLPLQAIKPGLPRIKGASCALVMRNLSLHGPHWHTCCLDLI
jgi:hypothetical protein